MATHKIHHICQNFQEAKFSQFGCAGYFVEVNLADQESVIATQTNVMHLALQWNPFNVDTLGTWCSVLYTVEAL